MQDEQEVTLLHHVSEPTHLALLLGVGLIAGVINVLAGGGTLITLPALIFLGLPETTANGTVRLAILAQNLTALSHYHRQGAIPWAPFKRWAFPVLLGAALGAWTGTHISDAVFRPFLIAVILAVGLGVALRPERFFSGPPLAEKVPSSVLAIIMVAVGFHGGFIQAGVGYLLLGSLTLLGGLSLVKANVLKLGFVTLYTPLALVLFAMEGKVDWVSGAVLALSQALGGYLGANAALQKGDLLIRRTLLLAVALAALKLAELY